jgi:hypothetical protein
VRVSEGAPLGREVGASRLLNGLWYVAGCVCVEDEQHLTPLRDFEARPPDQSAVLKPGTLMASLHCTKGVIPRRGSDQSRDTRQIDETEFVEQS